MIGFQLQKNEVLSNASHNRTVLVLGGAQQHCKLAEAARRLGARSIVVDYLEDSPAKRIADMSFNVDVKDLGALEEICRRESVDGVVAGWLDPCQLPYFELCEKLGLRHYGTKKAFQVMTDKELFKAYCREWGVGTIPYLCGEPDQVLSDLNNSGLRYPLFVKPVDSRGSRGQAVCNSREEIEVALEEAALESSNGKVIVEEDMTGADDISVTYFFVDGEAYLERISDRILGEAADGLSNVCAGTISPSKHYERYMSEAHPEVVRMLKSLGIENGPVFMQGFVSDDGFYFYDPGLRFPGGDYERAVKEAVGIDLAEALVRFSLGDRLCAPDSDLALLGGRVEVIHDVCLSPGVIESVCGIDEIRKMEGVVSVNLRYGAGDSVPLENNVCRRFAEINFLASDYFEAFKKSWKIQSVLAVVGERGDMKVSSFADGFAKWIDSFGGGRGR